MPAVFPGAVKTYTNKFDGTSVVLAADINSVQEEINAIETAVGINAGTTTLGATVGTYSVTPTASVAGRVGNLEAAITNSATDGSLIGYTLLASGSFTSASNNDITSISQAYNKLVLHIAVTAFTSGGIFNLRPNGNAGSGYSYTRQVYGTPTPGTSTGVSEFVLGTVSALDNAYVIELPAYNTSAPGKPITWLAHSLSGTGYVSLNTPITSLRFVTTGGGTYTYSYKLYGVK